VSVVKRPDRYDDILERAALERRVAALERMRPQTFSVKDAAGRVRVEWGAISGGYGIRVYRTDGTIYFEQVTPA